MKKNLARILSVMMCLIVMISFSTMPVNAATKKPGKVKSSSIVYTGTDSTYSTMSFKWKKVKGAKGYQVRIINSKAYEDVNVIEYYITGNSKKNKITLYTASLQRGRLYRLQVRAYKKKGDRRVFGKWSTSESKFAAFIPMKPAPAPTPTPALPSNTSVTASPASATIAVGDTKTFIIGTDKGEGISYTCNNSNVSCTWGDWIGGGNSSYFYVKGVREGTSTITVYDTNNPAVKTYITVTVQPKIDPRYNTTMSVNRPNITINQGETVTLEVYTDKGEDISADWNDSYVDFIWGDWFGTNDQNSYFDITGLNKGTSTVTIYDDHNTSVKATVTVTVR